MKLLNFSHPITSEQLSQIERAFGLDVSGEPLDVVIVRCHLDIGKPFSAQAIDLADRCDLSEEKWQTETLVINPPALSSVAVLLLAEIHGRCGYYPHCVRLKKADGMSPRYELAEVMDVDGQRQRARQRR